MPKLSSPSAPRVGLTLDLALDLAFGDRLVPVNEPAVRSQEQQPGAERVDDPEVPNVMDPRTLAETLGRPAPGVVVPRHGPDGHKNGQSAGRPSGTAAETAPSLDLSD